MVKSFVLFLILISTGCAINAAQSNTDLPSKEIFPSSNTSSLESASLNTLDEDNGFVKSISLNRYNFSVKTRRSKFRNGNIVEVNYAVISRNGKPIIKLRELPESLAEFRFKQMPNTGTFGKDQVAVETTMSKYWRYQIFNLSPKFGKVFDSDRYDLGHDLQILDINQDGVNEISMDLMTFDYFGVNYRKGWVTPQIIFKYDKNRNKYIFANQDFKEYLLKNVDSKIAEIDKINNERQTNSEYDSKIYSAVMDVFLAYIYTGEETKAWEIFDRYKSADKTEVRAEIKRYLAKDFIYNLIQKNKLKKSDLKNSELNVN